jgi:hypothetical protein
MGKLIYVHENNLNAKIRINVKFIVQTAQTDTIQNKFYINLTI